MRVAAADGDLVPLLGELRGVTVGGLEHVAVARLDGREVFLEPGEVLALAPPGHAREDVVYAEEEPALGEIHQQGDQVVAPLLELGVLALMEVVDANVDFRTAGHPARQLLAEEE